MTPTKTLIVELAEALEAALKALERSVPVFPDVERKVRAALTKYRGLAEEDMGLDEQGARLKIGQIAIGGVVYPCNDIEAAIAALRAIQKASRK